MQVNQKNLTEFHLKADKIMPALVAAHWFFAAFISSISYQTYLLGAVGGGLLFTLTVVTYIFFKAQRIFRILLSVILMMFSTIYIQQHLGRIEFHFHIFIAISFLSIYKDYLPTIMAGITTTMYHILFYFFQAYEITIFGEGIYLFNYGCGWDIVFLHIFFVVCEVMIVSLFIRHGKKQFFDMVATQNSYHELNLSLEHEVLNRTSQLRKINELYEESQSINHLGHWEWDIVNDTLSWNSEIYRILNLESQAIEASYDVFLGYVHPEDREKVRQNLKEAINLNHPYDITHRLLLLDNSVKYVRERGKTYKDENNIATRMIGTMQEVSSEVEIQNSLEESEKKFRLMSEHTNTGIFIFKDRFCYVNRAMEVMTEYSNEELSQMNPLSLFPLEESKELPIDLERCKAGVEFSKEYDAMTIMTKGGKEKIVSMYTTTITYDGGFAGLGTLIDITNTKKAEEELRTLSQVVEQTDDIVKITKADGTLTYVNDAFVAHTGFTRREVIGKNPSCLKSGEHSQEFYSSLWDTILAGDVFRAIIINRKRDKSLYHEEQTITPIIDAKGNISSFVSTGKDISERIELENRLKEMAIKDKLTNTYNRHKFDEMLLEEFERYERYGNRFSLIMLDVDHFKKINDTYGHDVGDTVLVEFSKLIKESIRKVDKLSRWGGEEFIILCSDTNEDAVMRLAEKLRILLEHHPFEKVKKVTASFGVVTFREGKNVESLLKELDNALYQAKQKGRNCVVQLK